VVLLGALVVGVMSLGGDEAPSAAPISPPQTSAPRAPAQQAPAEVPPTGGATVTPNQTAATTPPATTQPQQPDPATPTPRGGGAATPPPSPARVNIGQVAGTMEQGGTATATAEVFASSGAAMSGGFTLVWRSSNPAAVMVAPRTGVLRAAGPGTSWIVAAAGDARDSVRVTVAPAATPPPNQPVPRPGQPAAPTVARVEIAEADLDLQVGSPPRPLSALVLDSSGRRLGRRVTWSSSDPQVASVDASGRVTAVGAGSARITATVGASSAQVGVSVAEAPPAPASRPAPAASAPALPSAPDARTAIEGYVAVLGSNDRDTVTRLWGSAAEGRRGDLLNAMGQRQFQVTLGTVSSPVADGAAATVTFPVAVAWRTSFGQNRSGNFNFRARLERSGSEWRLASVVLE
jgi:hypothetical protein